MFQMITAGGGSSGDIDGDESRFSKDNKDNRDATDHDEQESYPQSTPIRGRQSTIVTNGATSDQQRTPNVTNIDVPPKLDICM